jgi:peptidoglycan/xylan/chitin deacetylase (PgdA/CDA1 family)
MSARATVIVYHGVGKDPRERDPYRLLTPLATFTRQMEYLSRHRRVVPLDTIVAGKIPKGRPAVAITFDDGYRSVLHEAMPILRRFGYPATCFVPTWWIGKVNGWDAFQPTDCPPPILSGNELRELGAAGVEIASHGHGHVPLGEIDEDAALADVAMSRETLTDLLGHAPRYLAYPYGSQSPAAQRAVRAAGFDAAFSIGQRDQGNFGRERVTIRPADAMALYAFKTSGRYLGVRESRLGDTAFALIRPAVLMRRARG